MLDREVEEWVNRLGYGISGSFAGSPERRLSPEEQKQVLRALARRLNDWADNIEDGG